jgi:hypothetical protein
MSAKASSASSDVILKGETRAALKLGVERSAEIPANQRVISADAGHGVHFAIPEFALEFRGAFQLKILFSGESVFGECGHGAGGWANPSRNAPQPPPEDRARAPRYSGSHRFTDGW